MKLKNNKIFETLLKKIINSAQMFTLRIGLIVKDISTKVLRKEGNINLLNRKYICGKMPDSPIKTTKRVLKFERLSENAYPPTRGSKLAAGYDLYSAYDYVIPAMGKEMVIKHFLFLF
jgi:hypothetical protein